MEWLVNLEPGKFNLSKSEKLMLYEQFSIKGDGNYRGWGQQFWMKWGHRNS